MFSFQVLIKNNVVFQLKTWFFSKIVTFQMKFLEPKKCFCYWLCMSNWPQTSYKQSPKLLLTPHGTPVHFWELFCNPHAKIFYRSQIFAKIAKKCTFCRKFFFKMSQISPVSTNGYTACREHVTCPKYQPKKFWLASDKNWRKKSKK